MNSGLTTLFLLVCLTIGAPLLAQIVNIEDKRSDRDTTGTFWQVDFGGNCTENTRSVVTLSGALRLDILRVKRQWLLLGNYNLVRSDQDQVLNDGFGHLRYGQELGGAWSWEAFAQLQYNRRLLIDQRALLGTGPRFQVQDREKLDLAIGLLVMYEYNELGDEPDLLFRHDYRISTYLTAQMKLTDDVTLASTSYYQPLVDRLGESRLSSVNALNVRLGQHLSFGTSFAITYDGLLASLLEGVPATSFRWRNLLRITF
ncbi:MAG: DUF481 domain-containing protein [Bacteroidota bacterium]